MKFGKYELNDWDIWKESGTYNFRDTSCLYGSIVIGKINKGAYEVSFWGELRYLDKFYGDPIESGTVEEIKIKVDAFLIKMQGLKSFI